jgi:hypothetical protein
MRSLARAELTFLSSNCTVERHLTLVFSYAERRFILAGRSTSMRAADLFFRELVVPELGHTCSAVVVVGKRSRLTRSWRATARALRSCHLPGIESLADNFVPSLCSISRESSGTPVLSEASERRT